MLRILIVSIVLFCSCNKEDIVLTRDDKGCGKNTSGKLLIKKSTKFYGELYNFDDKTEHYFYDDQNRIDSILTISNSKPKSSYKFIYNSNNRLEHQTFYDLLHHNFYTYTFEYESDNNLEKIFFSSNTENKRLQQILKTSELEKTISYQFAHENASSRYLLTYDDCNNVIKQQSFYISDNTEHLLIETEYTDVLNPIYSPLIPKGSPFLDNTPYLMKSSEIVHWDCAADYLAGKQITKYETNEFNLPTKSKHYHDELLYTSEYFYRD